MTTTSETMKRNWQNPEFRERAKKGRDRYYKEKMKKRLVELANGKSDSDEETEGEDIVDYRQATLDEFS
jgi:hypothetical protein